MFDDFQDQYKPDPVHDSSKPNKKGMLLFAFIVWVIFTSVLILAARPKITATLKETNAVEIFKNRKQLRQKTLTGEATLYFVSIKDFSKYTLIGFRTNVKLTGESPLHDAVEGLLAGPPDAAFKYGAVTMIPDGTKLKGLTVSNGIAFVDLSSEFGNGIAEDTPLSDYVAAARWQILKTLQATDSSITKVVLLIDSQQI